MLTPLWKGGDIPQKKLKWLRYWQTFLRSDDLALILILTHSGGLSLGPCGRAGGQMPMVQPGLAVTFQKVLV